MKRDSSVGQSVGLSRGYLTFSDALLAMGRLALFCVADAS